MSDFLVEQVSGETGCEDESTDLGVNGQKGVDEAMKGESVDESATDIWAVESSEMDNTDCGEIGSESEGSIELLNSQSSRVGLMSSNKSIPLRDDMTA